MISALAALQQTAVSSYYLRSGSLIVTRLQAGRPRNRGSIPGKAKSKHPGRLWSLFSHAFRGQCGRGVEMTSQNHFLPRSKLYILSHRPPWQTQELLPILFFNVLLTVHRDISVQYEPEPIGRTIYFQFTSLINLYMFRADLLLIIRKY